MCKKEHFKLTVTCHDFCDGRLKSHHEKTFEKFGCFRCSYNDVIRSYIAESDTPWQMVDTMIDDNIADICFEVHYTEGKRYHKRRVILFFYR